MKNYTFTICQSSKNTQIIYICLFLQIPIRISITISPTFLCFINHNVCIPCQIKYIAPSVSLFVSFRQQVLKNYQVIAKVLLNLIILSTERFHMEIPLNCCFSFVLHSNVQPLRIYHLKESSEPPASFRCCWCMWVFFPK